MSYAKAKIWARLIHKGEKTIDDVAKKDQKIVREAYLDLFGEEI